MFPRIKKREYLRIFPYQMYHCNDSNNNLPFGEKTRPSNHCSSPASLQFIFLPILPSTSPILTQDLVLSTSKLNSYVV